MPAVLVTGATGLVGGQLVPHLLERKPSWRILVLVRDPSRLSAHLRDPRIVPLNGDLLLDGLGLDQKRSIALRRSVIEIIHCAAETRFDRSVNEARAVNLDGTARLLQFAQGCHRLTKFLHVSTAYVAGQQTGNIPEAAITHPARFTNTYQQSKYEAEQLVSAEAWALPVAIARISSIIGDSATGAVRQFNYVHQLIRLYPQCAIPVAPCEPDSPVDVVASDWVASALAALFEDHFESGAVYHLCAGGSDGFTVSQMLADLHRLFLAHPEGQKWTPIRLPRMVSLAEWDDYAAGVRLEGKVLLNELLRVLNYFVPHLGIHQTFENHRTLARLASSGLALPPARDLFGKVVRWCLDTDWGKRCPRD